MRLVYDRNKVQESIGNKGYDERNLAICKCGKHRYPSKLMFIRFLEQFSDIKGTGDIWSESDWTTGKSMIHVEVSFKVFKDKKVAEANPEHLTVKEGSQ